MAQETYRIVIDGRLSDHFADGFDNMAQHQDGADTILEGTLVDQAHLHGLLDQIRGLGIRITGFATVEEERPCDDQTQPITVSTTPECTQT